MKAYTDLEQSKKLAEILPLKSTDQTWVRIAIAGANLDVPEELQYKHSGDMPFKYYSGIGIPCWSLAALIDILPEEINVQGIIYSINIHTKNKKWFIDYKCNNEEFVGVYSNIFVDACVAMIEKLHELKIL